MSNPFDQFDAPAPAPGANPFDQFDAPPPDPAATPEFSSSILPMTRYKDGHVGFDSNAGLLGAVKSAFTLPGDVATGKVDVNSPEAIARSATLAGMASPMAPGAQILSTGVKAVAVPTADALHAAGGAGFEAMKDMGVSYHGPSVANVAAGAQQQLNAGGVTARVAPVAHGVLDDLRSLPDGSVPLSVLDAYRKTFSRLQGSQVGEERYAGRAGMDAINQFVSTADPGTVAGGPAAEAAPVLRDAIANSAAGFRSDRINGIARAADLRSSAANSGMNIGNTTRQKVTNLLLSDRQSAGFNPDEIGALEDVVHGSTAANAMRKTGNMLGGGGGLGHSLVTGAGASAGAAIGGEAGAFVGGGIAGGLGPAFKAGQNALDTRALSAVDEMVRQRSPLYAAAQANAPQVVNVGQTLANGAARPLSSAFLLSGVNSSLNGAPPGSRQSDLASVLTGAHPGLGAAFQQ